MTRQIIQTIIVSFFLLGSLFSTLQAQTPMEDVVYLKDGSVIRGKIVEQIIGEHIKIELLGGSVLVYEESEVVKITREPSLHAPTQVTTYPSTTKKFSDYPITLRAPKTVYNMFAFGLAFGQGFNGNVGLNPSFTYKVGMHFSQYLNLGLGIGLDPYEGGTVSPLFVNVSGEVGRPAEIMPHYFVDFGYGMPLGGSWNTNVFRGGPMLHAGGGWKFNSRRRSEWTLTLGYKFQHTYQERQIWLPQSPEPVSVIGTRFYQKIVMQVAIGF